MAAYQPRILLVDDEEDLLEALAEILETADYEVHTATTDSAARELCRDHRPDVALVDVRLRNSSGIGLIGELRESNPDLLCVMMTAHATVDVAIQALQHGAYDFMRKPVAGIELLATVERCVENVRLRREQRQAEADLRMEQSRLQAVLGAFPGGMSIVNDQHEITYENEILREAFAGLGQKCYRAYWDKESVCEECPAELTFADGKSHMTERRMPRLTGDHAYVEVTTSLVPNDGATGQSCLVVISNVTERKQLEEQLLHAQKMDAIGRLAGGVAHDMNNILGGIMGYASIAQLDVERGGSLFNDFQAILTACKRGRDLTGNLLGFARRGKLTADLISVTELVAAVEGLLSRTIPKLLVVETDLEPDLAHVRGDPGQLNQALLNVCLNGIDAMNGEGVLTIAAKKVVLAESDVAPHPDLSPGSYIGLRVSDHGAGMTPNTLARAFEPFFTTKSKGKGTGLGLSMVYGTVTNHGGAVVIDSEVGRGTTVTMFLPVAHAHAGDSPTSRAEETPAQKTSGLILLVDDDEVIRSVGKRLLERLGHEVLLASNGKDAIAAYAARRDEIVLVVLDIVMPVMDGTETYRELVELNPDVTVLIASGHSEEGQAKAILADGKCGFIQKPFDLEQLSSALERVLGNMLELR